MMLARNFIVSQSHVLPRIVTSTTIRWYNRNDPSARKSKKKKHSGRPAYRFVDKIRLRAIAGDGGKGCVSMQGIKRGHKKIPDGGHGGRGGHVILVADPKKQSLRISHHIILADSGKHGSSQQKTGKGGTNKIIRVPYGVVIRRVLEHNEEWNPETKTVTMVGGSEEDGYNFYEDIDLGLRKNDDSHRVEKGSNEYTYYDHEEEYDYDDTNDYDNEEEYDYDNEMNADEEILDVEEEEREKVLLTDLDKPGSWYLVSRGGLGGRGNSDFASVHGPPPDANSMTDRASPTDGETSYLELELKLIADLGLVGFPNAGKSSLLAAMSRATPEIAPYPFTTLHPLIGVVEYQDGTKIKVADVPGLVSGASKGRGRGHDFLRHIERNKALVYMVDSAGTDGRDPLEDLKILTQELASYTDGSLLKMPAIVVANKIDLLSDSQCGEILLRLGEIAEEAGVKFNGEVMGISAGVTGEGLTSLSRALRKLVPQQEKECTLVDY
eukprot:CAMPEP_0194174246 /NCGR_PEP_ID=MMETSP0154-20130528/8483_1 /TAXON_ID=1049557 /ORGANISM="Thalassiothrix antarctica, Strain L6-D1" /LENGTH=494 /DNA_ID=CAMNT_0038887613 /DNA_START=43 /DNA_END=1527 /DNA_ORIENTATION=+